MTTPTVPKGGLDDRCRHRRPPHGLPMRTAKPTAPSRWQHPRNIHLDIGRGRMADDLRSLKQIKTVDVTTEAQLALHMPVPISVRAATGASTSE